MRHGRVDTHAHFIPPSYRHALADAGVETSDGGVPFPPWSLDEHLAMMDRHEIELAVLSLSSPGVHVLDEGAAALARAVNRERAEMVRAHPDRFGLFVSLPLPDVEASLEEISFAFV